MVQQLKTLASIVSTATFVETQILTIDYGHSWCLCGIFFFLQKGKEKDTQELDSEEFFFDRSISIFHCFTEELGENNPPDFSVVHVEVVQMENNKSDL